MDRTRLGSTWPQDGIAHDLDGKLKARKYSTWPRDSGFGRKEFVNVCYFLLIEENRMASCKLDEVKIIAHG